MTKRLKKLFVIFCSSFVVVFSGCSKVVIRDTQIHAHWMHAGEKAPFDGVLLNDYTYYKLRKKLNECGN